MITPIDPFKGTRFYFFRPLPSSSEELKKMVTGAFPIPSWAWRLPEDKETNVRALIFGIGFPQRVL